MKSRFLTVEEIRMMDKMIAKFNSVRQFSRLANVSHTQVVRMQQSACASPAIVKRVIAFVNAVPVLEAIAQVYSIDISEMFTESRLDDYAAFCKALAVTCIRKYRPEISRTSLVAMFNLTDTSHVSKMVKKVERWESVNSNDLKVNIKKIEQLCKIRS